MNGWMDTRMNEQIPCCEKETVPSWKRAGGGSGSEGWVEGGFRSPDGRTKGQSTLVPQETSLPTHIPLHLSLGRHRTAYIFLLHLSQSTITNPLNNSPLCAAQRCQVTPLASLFQMVALQVWATAHVAHDDHHGRQSRPKSSRAFFFDLGMPPKS